MGSLAERLRDVDNPGCLAFHVMKAVDPAYKGTCVTGCEKCWQKAMDMLADAIETSEKDAYEAGYVKGYDDALERTKTEHDGVDVAKLLGGAETLESWAAIAAGNPNTCVSIGFGTCLGMANRIRKAVKGAKPKLPEGIEWPTYEDGELVEFGDVAKVREDIGEVIEIRFHTGKCSEVTIAFEDESTATHYMVVDGPHIKRHEPEVLGADNLPIKVGDTVYHEVDGSELIVVGFRDEKEDGEVMVDVEGKWLCVRQFSLTHRKPDTQEAIETDCRMEAYNYLKKRGICPPKSDYESQKAWKRDCRRLQKSDLLERQRKLLGGE